MANLLPVAFHGDTLYLVELDGEPFTPARPICDAIGVSWQGQHVKLTGHPRWSVKKILTDAGAEMICIPVRKLAGWLASINPRKVSPELSEKIEAYQAECDDALWRYWTEGHARRPGTPEQGSLDLPAPRLRAASLPQLCPSGWHGDRVAAARQQLECASGILAGIEFARDSQARLDLLTAAHSQCQVAGLFIGNHYDEVRNHG